MQKIYEYQTPNSPPIYLSDWQVQRLAATDYWPTDAQGQEYVYVRTVEETQSTTYTERQLTQTLRSHALLSMCPQRLDHEANRLIRTMGTLLERWEGLADDQIPRAEMATFHDSAVLLSQVFRLLKSFDAQEASREART